MVLFSSHHTQLWTNYFYKGWGDKSVKPTETVWFITGGMIRKSMGYGRYQWTKPFFFTHTKKMSTNL